jgi:hypothetical protein
MFLNFSGYDPLVLTNFTQLLGDPDFVLPNNRISPTINLFSLVIAPTAPLGSYSFDVNLQDINNNSSSTVTATVQVGSAVPEPSSAVLAATGFACASLLALAKRHGRASEVRGRA